jgi:hypothetical protein
MNEATMRIEALSDALVKLSPRDRTFGADLIEGFSRRKTLSDKQWYWVETLTTRATQPAPERKTESVGDFGGVIRLFERAKQKLKFPKITLQVGALPVQLSLAGQKSQHPGTVNVTDGGPYGANLWFGRVDQAGVWTQGLRATAQETESVRSFLQAFSKDPAGTAKQHGRLTGRCCFCNTKLTDDRSTAAGFGPVCAKNFGLDAEWKAATAFLAAAATDARVEPEQQEFCEDSRFDDHDGVGAVAA